MPALTPIAGSAIAGVEDEVILTPSGNAIYLDPRPVMVTNSSHFYRAYRTDATVPEGEFNTVVWDVQRTGLTLAGQNRDGTFRNDPSVTKLLREIIPLFRGPEGQEISIYAGAQARTPEDPIAWQGPFPYVIGEDVSVYPLVEGVYLALRFFAYVEPHEQLSLLAYDLDIELTGEPS